MADVTLPPGWMALPGGQVYNPATNQILSQSQAAYAFSVPNPEQYLPAQTPVAPPTPTYGMDENGNIAPIATMGQDTGGMMYSAQSLAAGYNPQSGIQPTTQFNGQTYTLDQLLQNIANPGPATTFATPTPPPAAGTPEWINWIMSGAALSPVDQPAAPPSGISAIRDNVGTAVQPFPTASPSNSGTTMLGTTPNYGTSETNFPQQTPWAPAPSPAPQYSTVQDTSAWRANPTALTPMQQAGRGMLYS